MTPTKVSLVLHSFMQGKALKFFLCETRRPRFLVFGTRVLQKVLSLGSDYFSATFYQTYFYYKPSKYSPFTETHFCNLFTQSRKADSLLLVSVGNADK